MPGIFLSHSSKDKEFVRRFGQRLEEAGLDVWLDEAQIDIGDSLVEKIGEAISKTDFVAAFISKQSVQSRWVKKELNIAMTMEIKGKSGVVLPIVIDDCTIPVFLTDKLYADFRDPNRYDEEFERVLRAINRHTQRKESTDPSAHIESPSTEKARLPKMSKSSINNREAISRRKFFLFGSVAAITLGITLEKPIQRRRDKMNREKIEEVRNTVFELQQPTKVKTLLEAFQNYDSANLMQSYVIGFNSLVLLSLAGKNSIAISRLKEAVTLSDKFLEKPQKNKHRIKAFPSCLAAHFLPSLELPEQIEALNIINTTFNYDHRECGEIIAQNLTSAMTRDEHAWNNYYVNDDILDTLRFLLSKRLTNPHYNVQSNMIIQFLIYYRLSLLLRESNKGIKELKRRQIALIEKSFDEIKNTKDSYSWFVNQWYDTLNRVCTQIYSKHKQNLDRYLPPQSSELALGWKNCSRLQEWQYWKSVLPSAMMNNSLLYHFNKMIINNDKGASSLFETEYGVKEANVAINKLDEFFKKLEINENTFKKAISLSEGPFKQSLMELASKSASTTFVPTEWDPVLSLVPFKRQYRPITCKSDSGDIIRLEEILRNSLYAIGGAGILSWAGNNLLDIGRKSWKFIFDKTTPKEIGKDVEPNNQELEKLFSRRDFIRKLRAYVDLSDGNIEEYEKESK